MIFKSDGLTSVKSGENAPNDGKNKPRFSISPAKYITCIIVINFLLSFVCCISAQDDQKNTLEAKEEEIISMGLKNGSSESLGSQEKPETEVFSFLATKEQDISYVRLV